MISKNVYSAKRLLFILFPFLLLLILQHDFVDRTYHSVISSEKTFKSKFDYEIKTLDTHFSKGRLIQQNSIYIEDLVKFHGHYCDGLIAGALALKFALSELNPDGFVDRTNTRIVSKSSPCLADVAIYLTGARYQYDRFFVSDSIEEMYVVQRIDTGKAISVKMKSSILPTAISEMGAKAIKEKLSSCELEELKSLEDDFGNWLLTQKAEDVFTLEEQLDFKWEPILKSNFVKTDILNKNKERCK